MDGVAMDRDVPAQSGAGAPEPLPQAGPPATNTDGASEVRPSIKLPLGGGAIRGIGEKFDVSAATGTGSLKVPVVASPGRSGFGPRLTLSYDSGAPNGPYGLGWSVALPSITRKTDRGIPRYRDDEESDDFVLTGAEDLVPVTDPALQPVSPRRLHGVDYDITAYRPRIEGLFSRIERWVDRASGLGHWRTISRDNLTTLYGIDDQSRIADPDDGRRIYAYLIRRTFDDRGNVTVYEYAPEDERGVDLTQAHEANRTNAQRSVGRYLKTVRYGNATPYHPTWNAAPPETPLPTEWHFSLVFDYGDHNSKAPAPDPSTDWPVRPDPFSTHRPGFELRTYRRCKRILLFHDFPNEATVGAGLLVRSTDLRYSDEVAPADPANPIYTFLQTVIQAGYRRQGATYLRRAMPPLEFEYSPVELSDEVRSLDAESGANLPEGVDGTRFQLIDLDGEGLPGVLAMPAGGWIYKRNLGGAGSQARFGAAEPVTMLPVGQEAPRLIDLAGDGRLDAVAFNGVTPGFSERTPDGGWEGLTPFRSLPPIDFSQPNLRLADVTGDGLADALITEPGTFTVYRSLGEHGFDEAERVATAWDEAQGPAVVFADGTQTILMADMSGDGLSDLVRVRGAEVCYWPCLGHGRYGSRVTMDNAPRLGDDTSYDPRRVRLADIDGSGTADLLYLAEDGVQVCFNQCGNGWGPPRRLAVFPAADDVSAVETADLLGTGTTCLVWSTPLPGEPRALRYVDLMGGSKPHLMVRSRNNLGAETRLRYAPSTRYYVADRLAGRPWLTRLPFPVHVVERVETVDWIARSRLVTHYDYHHGFFSAADREFRGFGMVEQRDSEELREDTDFPELDALNWDAASWSPPTLARTWFHTGAFAESPTVAREYAREYWVEPALQPANRAADREALLLPDAELDPALTADEIEDAHRALKGRALRTEIYADDGSANAGNPYTVTEETFAVRRVQGRGDNRHPVVLVVPRETLAYHYERAAGDPRTTHEVTLEVDDFGNAERTVSVSYGRRPGPPPEPNLALAFRTMLAYDQARLHVVATQKRYTNALADPVARPDVHRARLESETIVAELTGIAPSAKGTGITDRFAFAELEGHWTTLWSGAHDVPYEQLPRADLDGIGGPGVPTRRIVQHSRTRYRADDLTGLLALHQLEPRAVRGEAYRLALTPGHLTRIFGSRVPDSTLVEGGYVHLGAAPEWWIPTGRVSYTSRADHTPAQELAEALAHFFRPRRAIDPFGGIISATPDAYDLLEETAVDAVGNVTTADNDYRVLGPRLVTDENGNQTEVAYDVLGRVAGKAVMGKPGENLGDTLAGFDPDPDENTLLAQLDDPLADPGALLADATSRVVYDVGAYQRTRDDPEPRPPVVYMLARESHVSDVAANETSEFTHSFSYSDGFGRTVQAKAQAEPARTAAGRTGPPRWVGTGWTVYDNKGNAVRSYEPFFSATHRFEFARQVGVSTVRLYDPVARAVAALHPDDTWEKVVFAAWGKETWDVNDTVAVADPRADPHVGERFERLLGAAPYVSWYDRRKDGAFGATPQERAAQQDAALKAAAHAGTCTVEHSDARARTCLTVVDAGGGARHPTRTAVDVEGNPLAVIDPLGRHVTEICLREPVGAAGFRYVSGYDIAGNLLYRKGLDEGERRTLVGVAGNQIRAWDALERTFRTRYDAALRPTHHYVRSATGSESLISRTVYGEGLPADRNLAGRMYRTYDACGLAGFERYDFRGNIAESVRHLAVGYRGSVDWSPIADVSAPAALDAATASLLAAGERYVTTGVFDALGRPRQMVVPRRAGAPATVLQVTYAEGGLPDAIDAWIRRANPPAGLLDPATADVRAVGAIDYDARGRRSRVQLGNGTVTTYEHDRLTLRLTRLTTERPAFPTDRRVVQDLHYAYDPAANVTSIRDDADIQNVVFFNNQRVDPSADYTYDALYRLTAASGREHLGQVGGALAPPAQVTHDDGMRTRRPHPADGSAMGRFTETYAYDAADNLQWISHQAGAGSWKRRYAYTEPSAIDASQNGNRLSATSLPGDPPTGPFSARYVYDALGAMTAMPHLPALTWDERGELRSSTRQHLGSGTPETTYQGYDSDGERVRKVTDGQAAAGQDPSRDSERLYLGALEIHRRYDANGTVRLERETLHIDAGTDRVALVETRTIGTDPAPARLVRFQYGNHIDSALLELDDAAEIISYEEYFPYGSSSFQSVRSQNETPKRYRYTGREREEESDLYQHGARFYAPWLGRWTSSDPAGIGDGLNRYAYVRNNPVRLRDPSGTQGVYDDEAAVCRPEYSTCSPENPAGITSPPPANSIREVRKAESAGARAPPDDIDWSAYDDPSADREPGLLARAGEALAHDEDVQLGFGLLYGGLIGAAPGGFLVTIGQEVTGLSEELPPHFRLGQGVGEAAWGVAQFLAGAVGEGIGITLDLTGIGAVVGVPINVASAAVAIEGAADVAVGGYYAMKAHGDTKTAPPSYRTVRQHRAGNRQVELKDGRRYHLPENQSPSKVPKVDKVGDRLQAEVKKAAEKWSDDVLSANERLAIKEAKEQAATTGEWWKPRLLLKQAQGRFIHEQVKAWVKQNLPTVKFSGKGVDFTDTATGLKYEVLSGTTSNLDLHALRMAKDFFRMLTFTLP